MRRRSSRLSGHQLDAVSGGAQQRRSGSGLLPAAAAKVGSAGGVSPRNSANLSKGVENGSTGLRSRPVSATDRETNSGLGPAKSSSARHAVENEKPPLNPAEQPKLADEASSDSKRGADGSSATRRFGFIGGLWRRNRAATIPRRTKYDIGTGDDHQLPQQQPAVAVNRGSKTLPAGTLPPKSLSGFDFKKKTPSTGENRDGTAMVSPKRRTFSWWRRTPSSPSADAETAKSAVDKGRTGDRQQRQTKPNTGRLRHWRRFGIAEKSSAGARRSQCIGRQPESGGGRCDSVLRRPPVDNRAVGVAAFSVGRRAPAEQPTAGKRR
jgi:hypothetical protein